MILGTLEFCLRNGHIPNRRFDFNQIDYHEEGNALKVTLVGDSFLGKSMPINEELLKEFRKEKISYYNLALAGSSPCDSYNRYLNHSKVFDSNHLIFGYFVGNDISETQINGEDCYLDSYPASYLPEIYSMITEPQHSIENFDIDRWKKVGVKENIIERIKEGTTNPWLAELKIINPEYFTENMDIESEMALKKWEKNKRTLLKFKELAEKSGQKFSLIIFPRSIQINKDLYSFWQDVGFELSEKYLDEQKPQDLLKQFCFDHKIECLDFLPIFRAQKEKHYYKEFDDHFNDEGNRLVVSKVIEFIRKR